MEKYKIIMCKSTKLNEIAEEAELSIQKDKIIISRKIGDRIINIKNIKRKCVNNIATMLEIETEKEEIYIAVRRICIFGGKFVIIAKKKTKRLQTEIEKIINKEQ